MKTISKSLNAYCLLSSITGSNILLSHTRWSDLGLGYLKIPSYSTKTYDRYSMFVNSIYVWNPLLPHELPNDLRIRILGNKEILGKPEIWVET